MHITALHLQMPVTTRTDEVEGLQGVDIHPLSGEENLPHKPSLGRTERCTHNQCHTTLDGNIGSTEHDWV